MAAGTWSTTWPEGHDLDTRLRRTIEGLLILTLVVAPVAFGSRLPWAMALNGMGISLMTGFWVLRVSARGAMRLRRTPLDLPTLGLLLVSVLSSATSIYPYASVVETARLASYVLLYYVIVNNIRTRDSTYRILRVLVILGALLSAYGIYEVVSGSERVLWVPKKAFRGSVGAVTGTFWSKNPFGGFLTLIVPLGAGIALDEGTRSRWRQTGLYGAATLVALAGLIGTFSRNSWVGTTVALVSMGLLALYRSQLPTRYKLGVLAGGLTLALLIAGAVPWAVVDRFLLTFEANDASKTVRYQYFLSSLQMIRDRPLLGFGPGTFQYAWRAYRLPLRESVSADAVHAHNDWVQFGAEMGVLAPLLLLWLLFAHVRSGLRGLARSADWEGEAPALLPLPFGERVQGEGDRLLPKEGEAPAEPLASGNLGRAHRVDWILVALVASPVGLAVANIADFHWHIPATALLFWAILGLTRTWHSAGYEA